MAERSAPQLRGPLAIVAIAGLLASCNFLTGASEISTGEPTTNGSSSTPSAPSNGGNRTNDAGQNLLPVEDSTVLTVTAPEGLDFGEAGCGSSAAPRKIEIRNPTKLDVTFELATRDNVFTPDPASGTVAQGQTVEITVYPPVAPATGPVGPRIDELTVTTSAPGDTPHVFETTVTVSGAIFHITPDGPFSYGQVTGSRTQTLTMRNDGNIPGTLSYAMSGDTSSFSINGTAPYLFPGGSETRTVTIDPVNGGTIEKRASLSFSTTAVVCGAKPASISFTARRKND